MMNFDEYKVAKKAIREKDKIEESKWDKLNDNYECLLDFVKSFKQKAYDAWKPVQIFRSDNQVEIDEIKKEVLEELEQEALSVLEMVGETFD